MLQLFETMALSIVEKMQSVEGLLELFENTPAHVPLIWYYQSYLALLNRLGKARAGELLLQQVIATAPRNPVGERARELLVYQQTLLHDVGA